MFSKHAAKWIKQAELFKPALIHSKVLPKQIVTVSHDPGAFQGWAVHSAGPVSDLDVKRFHVGDYVILDFGEHTVGYLSFKISVWDGIAADAPLRLKVVFGEVPAEVVEPFDPFSGTLSRSWLQDECLNIDILPATVQMPRRYAFRYVRIEVTGASNYRVQLTDIACDKVTSADESKVQPLPASCSDIFHKIDEISCRTLRDCMQTVFEDGPKRDRRLWMGDLRLQALASYATFGNTDLVKRCLYLFAGLACEDGRIPACVYDEPVPRRGKDGILDYAVLYGVTLLDYVEVTGEEELARELWPVARRQIDIAMAYVNNDGLFIDPGNWWIFIDWEHKLHRQTAMNGVLIYGIRRMVLLAERLGMKNEAASLLQFASRLTQAARNQLCRDGLYVSGPDEQISWASQIWMILAGVMTPTEGRLAFKKLESLTSAVRPSGPYLYHYLIDAMLLCGLKAQALQWIEDYWGAMVHHGTTTFWEVFDPENVLYSPYSSHLINSYCHAWSCTPSYFIRQVFQKSTTTIVDCVDHKKKVKIPASSVAYQFSVQNR